MTLGDEIADIEKRLTAAGQSVRQLCLHAGVARSTWDRWKRGETEPNTRTWHTVIAAAASLTGSKAA